MAHQTITLQTNWFTRSSNELLWRPAAGQRVQIDAALLTSGLSVTRYWSNLLLRSRGGSLNNPHQVRMDLTDSQSGGFGGGTGQSLSAQFGSSGRIGIKYKTWQWVLDQDYVGDDTSEPYFWSVLGNAQGTPGGLLNSFISSVNDGQNAVNAELIIWDGQGTNPFTATPDPDPDPDPDPVPGTNIVPGEEIVSFTLAQRTANVNSVIWIGAIADKWVQQTSVNSALQLTTALVSSIDLEAVDLTVGSLSNNFFTSGASQDLTEQLEDAVLQIQSPDGNTTYWTGIIGASESEPYALDLSSAEIAALHAIRTSVVLKFSTQATGTATRKLKLGGDDVAKAYIGNEAVAKLHLGDALVLQ